MVTSFLGRPRLGGGGLSFIGLLFSCSFGFLKGTLCEQGAENFAQMRPRTVPCCRTLNRVGCENSAEDRRQVIPVTHQNLEVFGRRESNDGATESRPFLWGVRAKEVGKFSSHAFLLSKQGRGLGGCVCRHLRALELRLLLLLFCPRLTHCLHLLGRQEELGRGT